MEATKEDCLDKGKEEEEVHKLPGYRFHPTDEELVGFYLRRKVEKKPLRIEIIKQVDIYKYDPWDLPKEVSSVGDEKEKEWYYFCKRGRKYRNSTRPNRVTAGSGFWKATGIDKPIYSKDQSIIGLKKSLVYYRGSAGKGTKTDWMMHEFRLPPNTTNLQEAEVWTLCRILKRISSYKKYTPSPKGTAAITKTEEAVDSSSKSCSFESENFKDLVIQQNGRKPTIIGQIDYDSRNHLFLGQSASVAQVPQTTSLWAHNVFANANWDELRSVVQFANTDPSTLYDCT